MKITAAGNAVLLLALAAAVFVLPVVAAAGTSLVRIPAKGPIQFEQLRERNIEVLAVTKDGFIDVVADEKQLEYIFSLGYGVSVLMTEDMAKAAPALDSNLGLYHTYAELESVLTDWEAAYPSILDVFVVGTSIEGRSLYAMKISDNVTVDESEPEVLFMGNHHARELMSVDIPLRFAGYLLSNYGSDPEVTNMVDNREIFFVPMVNPDGHVYVQNNHGSAWWSWWRKNRRVNYDLTIGVDLNRNYGFAWGYDNSGSSPNPGSELYRGASPFSEPEVSSIRDFVESREFTIWLSYHSYGELLLYPWGYVPEYTDDHAVYAALGDTLAESNGYLAGNYAMGAIYVVNGDSDDWGYGEQATKGKIFAFTPEVNSDAEGGFGPPDTLIVPTFNKLLRMNMLTLEYADNPYRVVGPYAPGQHAIQSPYYPIHTLSWTGNDPADPNPVLYYEVERCKNPSFVTDEAEALSPDWMFDGFTLGAPYTGFSGYYSGSGDHLSHSITTVRPFFVTAESDTFDFWTSYAIELDWDYAYVEVSADGGGTWTTIEGNITTTSNPYGNNRGHGITGTAPGWVHAIFPLTAYLGQEVKLRISYITDASVFEHGIDVDVLFPVPRCASVDIVATSLTDTLLQIIPDEIATFRYRVHGVDAETHASGWSGSEDIVITTISDANARLAFKSRLGKNYPNPFNPSTRIPYTVGGPAETGRPQLVTLRVYSVTGQLVATLVDEQKAPGVYEATWDAAGRGGAPLASGIYFSRLVVGGKEVFTQKLVLLK